MPERDSGTTGDVDFVVGSDDSPEITSPVRGARRANMRLRLTLAGGALVLVLGTLIVRASAGHHVARQPTGAATSSAAPGPGPDTVAPAPSVAADLGPNLCPAGHYCSFPATPSNVRAGITAAIRKAFGKVSKLHIHDVGIKGDQRPRGALFAREIVGVIPAGRLEVQAAAVTGVRHLLRPTFGGSNDVGVQDVFHGYDILGHISFRKTVNGDLAGRIRPCSTTRA